MCGTGVGVIWIQFFQLEMSAYFYIAHVVFFSEIGTIKCSKQVKYITRLVLTIFTDTTLKEMN